MKYLSDVITKREPSHATTEANEERLAHMNTIHKQLNEHHEEMINEMREHREAVQQLKEVHMQLQSSIDLLKHTITGLPAQLAAAVPANEPVANTQRHIQHPQQEQDIKTDDLHMRRDVHRRDVHNLHNDDDAPSEASSKVSVSARARRLAQLHGGENLKDHPCPSIRSGDAASCACTTDRQ